MNSQAYAAGFAYHLSQWHTASELQRQMLEPVLDYCKMRYWLALGKEMVIDGNAEQYRAFVDKVGCRKRAMAIASMVQMERYGLNVTLDSYKFYCRLEMAVDENKGSAATDAG